MRLLPPTAKDAACCTFRGQSAAYHYICLRACTACIHHAAGMKLATLDSYRYRNVGFIKIDAEGSEMDIVDGARETILRCRPGMLIELLAVTHSDPLAHITETQQRFRNEAKLNRPGLIGGSNS